MTQTRNTYKTAAHPKQKYASITFRVTTEEREQIRKNAFDAGYRTESEYLRRICSLSKTEHLKPDEIQQIKTDITYCKTWINLHEHGIETALFTLKTIISCAA